MRPRLVIFLVVAFIGIVTSICFMFVRSPAPSATMRIIGYQFHEDSIIARVAFTNDGPCTFAYGDRGVDYRVVATVDGATTNYTGRCGIVPHVVFHPRMSTGFTISLPLRTQSWRCYFPCHLPSARERAVDRMIQSGLWNRIYPVSGWLALLLPSGRDSTIEIPSRVFEIPDRHD